MSRQVAELVRFSWVGLFTLGMYVVEMWLLDGSVSWPTWVKAALAYVPCVVVNYLLHRSFTFRSDKHHLHAGPRYLVIQLGGMGINSGVLGFGVDNMHWPFLASQLLALALLAAFSYSGQKLWAFL